MGLSVGHDFSTAVPCPGYPNRKRKDGEWTRSEKFWIRKDLAGNIIPEAGTPDDLGLLPRNVTIVDELEGFPGVAEVSIEWTGPDDSDASSWNGSDKTPTLRFETETQRSEKPLTSHPDWEKLSDEDQKTISEYFTSFTVITVIFRRIEQYPKKKYTFTEAGIIGNVNQKEKPKGLRSATEGKWMNTGKSISWAKGDNAEITESWEYDMYEWKGQLLPGDGLLEQLLAALLNDESVS